MMSPLRAAFALTACLMLSGCYLMSEAPRFEDAQAVALIGTETTTLAHFDLDGTTWKPSDPALVTMIPVDGHYLMHDPFGPEATEGDPILRFVPLDDSHWLMQLSAPDAEVEKTAYYAVATWDEHELLVHAIACDDLRDKPGITELVAFTDDNCTLLAQAEGAALALPALLWQDLPPGETKLVLQP